MAILEAHSFSPAYYRGNDTGSPAAERKYIIKIPRDRMEIESLEE
jgi:hypothetical protein